MSGERRIKLMGNYSLRKQDDNTWWLQYLGMDSLRIEASFCASGPGSSIDAAIEDFARENGQPHAAPRLPEKGWQFREAWQILDQLPHGVIPINARMLLAGLIAARLERAARRQHVQ